MKVNWDKFLWSWPVQVLNACCFVLILCVVAEDCRKTKEIKDKREVERIIKIINATK